MSEKPEPGVSFDPDADWLQVVQGRTPILLIAPHGGRAGKAARARLHPRINDLHTADITRELSRRLQAHALINTGMDRNALDCNRIEDIAHKAPWILARVAGQVEKLIDRHGHVLVLVIHGWNVVEARIDFGLGARIHSGRLRPVATAHITASEGFINGPLAHLCGQLQAAGILPTFGLRYPAAGRQNLLQIFTPRFEHSRLEPLRNLAASGRQRHHRRGAARTVGRTKMAGAAEGKDLGIVDGKFRAQPSGTGRRLSGGGCAASSRGGSRETPVAGGPSGAVPIWRRIVRPLWRNRRDDQHRFSWRRRGAGHHVAARGQDRDLYRRG